MIDLTDNRAYEELELNKLVFYWDDKELRLINLREARENFEKKMLRQGWEESFANPDSSKEEQKVNKDTKEERPASATSDSVKDALNQQMKDVQQLDQSEQNIVEFFQRSTQMTAQRYSESLCNNWEFSKIRQEDTEDGYWWVITQSMHIAKRVSAVLSKVGKSTLENKNGVGLYSMRRDGQNFYFFTPFEDQNR